MAFKASKSKSSQPLDDQDFASLDAAVIELAKRTDDLLGTADEDESETKPTLPKRFSHISHKGKSFDIFHNPHHKTQLKAPLKTNPEPDTEPHLATQILFDDEPSESVTSQPSDNKLIKEQSNQDSDNTESDTPSLETLPVVSDDISTNEANTNQLDEVHDESAEQTAPELSSDSANAEETVSSSGEIYANNLVKPVEPKGFTQADDQPQPTIFDTEEYHVAIHDWSKAGDHKSHKWLSFLILLVVAGIVAAAVFVKR